MKQISRTGFTSNINSVNFEVEPKNDKNINEIKIEDREKNKLHNFPAFQKDNLLKSPDVVKNENQIKRSSDLFFNFESSDKNKKEEHVDFLSF